MKPTRTTLVLLTLWSLAFAHTVKAATLAEFMGGYDWQSLRWAVGLSLLGGTLRTIFSLQSETRAIPVVAKEAAWDAAKALAAGGLVFIAIEAVRSSNVAVSSEVRFAAVLVAGILREAAIVWLRDLGRDWAAARREQLIARPLNDQPPKDAP